MQLNIENEFEFESFNFFLSSGFMQCLTFKCINDLNISKMNSIIYNKVTEI